MGSEDDTRLRIGAQLALLTHVTPELRSVSADIEPGRRLVQVRFIFAREPSHSERDAASCAAGEIIANYSDGWSIDEQYLVVPTPEKMSHLRLVVYHRCEDERVGPDA
ncbi:hypothetical protein TA3x_003795 [Tundrisphaera sp. TA3]|uniref:hypothetical protein n=1 Tax=Tundrisphaera sp. TA3 TaxID=3435775 RepID=UPI003EC0AFC9